MKVQFSNSLGYKLIGTFERPKIDKKVPAAIICHGFTANKDANFYPDLSSALVQNGLAVLRFDFTGNGESDGNFSEGDVLQEVRDVSFAIDYLETHENVSEVHLVGHSMAGAVALLSAKHEKRLKSIVLVSPGINYEAYISERFSDKLPEIESQGFFDLDVGNQKFRITKRFMDARRGLDFFEIIRKIHTPMLIVCGTDEAPSSRPDDIKRLFNSANEPKKLDIIEGADHNYSNPEHRALLIEKIVGFL